MKIKKMFQLNNKFPGARKIARVWKELKKEFKIDENTYVKAYQVISMYCDEKGVAAHMAANQVLADVFSGDKERAREFIRALDENDVDTLNKIVREAANRRNIKCIKRFFGDE